MLEEPSTSTTHILNAAEKKNNFLEMPLNIDILLIFIWRPDNTKCTINRTWRRINEIVPTAFDHLLLCPWLYCWTSLYCTLFLLIANHVNVGILNVPIDTEPRPSCSIVLFLISSKFNRIPTNLIKELFTSATFPHRSSRALWYSYEYFSPRKHSVSIWIPFLAIFRL